MMERQKGRGETAILRLLGPLLLPLGACVSCCTFGRGRKARRLK